MAQNSACSPGLSRLTTVASRPPVPLHGYRRMSFSVRSAQRRPLMTSSITAANSGPRWLIMGRLAERTTRAGSGVGPGTRSCGSPIGRSLPKPGFGTARPTWRRGGACPSPHVVLVLFGPRPLTAYSCAMGQSAIGATQPARAPDEDASRVVWATALAIALAIIAALFVVITVGLIVANRAHLHAVADLDLEDIIVPISLGGVGALVASRHSRNVIGWLFLFIAVVSGVQGLSDQYARYAFVTHPGAPG